VAKIGGVSLLGAIWFHETTTMSPGPRPTSVPSGILIHPAVCGQTATTDHGPKIEGVCLFFWGGRVLSSNLTLSRLSRGRPTSVPSFILIHPTVWPQYTNVTDRQDRTDRQTGQRSNSKGRTVLQTVVQKLI